MGLLQIGGESKQACGGRVAGIDLGTTNSLVAIVREGSPEALTDPAGQASVPSVVRYGEDASVEVGESARVHSGESSGVTIASAKRFMGRGQVDADAGDELSPYRFASEKDGPVVSFRVAENRKVTPVEVSSEILRVLKTRAEQALEGSLDGVVITVPAYFDDAQRQATKDAARLAGLTVLRLINEPTAAALAYGLDKKKEGLFAVFDLGGGTFDISILKLDAGVFQVLATGGDSRLGGDDFDRQVAEHFLKKSGCDPRDCPPEKAARALAAARTVKEALTTHENADFELEDTKYSLSRGDFEALIEPTLKRIHRPVRRVLKDCGIEGSELDGVVLVGGATRTPAVRRLVEARFGQKAISDLDPDQVVAFGAAAQANLLGGSGSKDQVLLLDVLSLSLAIETMGGVASKLLHRNQSIPASASQEFTTYADGQTGMDFHVVQGERELVKDCRSLARFKLSGIPPLPAGMAKVELHFDVDADGILQVSAEEKTTGKQASVHVKPSYGLNDSEIEKMILDSFEHAEDDVERRLVAEKRVEGARLLRSLEKALEEDGSLVQGPELEAFRSGMNKLEQLMAEGRSSSIQAQIEALDALSADFAVRRMNRTLRSSLRGQSAEGMI